jgi:predicted GIY-YIG superfamily endonuclease
MTTHVLYRMFDEGGTLLYVGITNDPKQRFHDHAKGQPWWSRVANIRVENHPSREALVLSEQVAIRDENPLYNIAVRKGLLQERSAQRRPRRCPTCGAPEPGMVPQDQWVLLMEDGTTMPFCTDPYHFPSDEVRARRVHEYRDELKRLNLLQLSEIAKARLDRQRELMEKAFAPLADAFPTEQATS